MPNPPAQAEMEKLDLLYEPDAQAQQPMRVEDVILRRGLVDNKQLDAARQVLVDAPGKTLGQALIETGALSENDLMNCVAEQYGLPFERLNRGMIAEEAFKLLPAEFIRRNLLLPLRMQGNMLIVATSDPANIFVLDETQRKAGRSISLVVATAADIRKVLDELSNGTTGANEVDSLIQDIAESDVEIMEEQAEDIPDLEQEAGESPVIRFVNYVIFNAVKEGASDIHIEPGEHNFKVRYRIDGILFDLMRPPQSLQPAVVSRLKIMANLDISERRLPQDGRIQAMIHGRHIDLRVSTLPLTTGEKAVIRILDNRSILIGLEKMGMDADTLAIFQKQIDRPHGIILVTGPTGSGKTTTLYSALRTMDGTSMNISTVEDPVEYHLAFANQVQVSDKIGLSFSAALRSLLRQDPDVIMVGEIRDDETARISVQASLTGHLVLSTLHTNDAPSSVTRLINIGVEPYLISASLNAVLAQRLIRCICPHCKGPATLTTEMTDFMVSQGLPTDKVFVGAGCDKCRKTGYAGRSGIFELLLIDDACRDLIVGNPSVTDLRRFCKERGMVSLRESGFAKVAAGVTTIDEILRVTEDAN
ncbi:MAG: ATPase, T2SS/T4P/T4SS family [Phycisphaerae bacterium]|nr:ATPase, T2SS/T4P/T4SS family [Phycisphaerae bacterium]